MSDQLRQSLWSKVAIAVALLVSNDTLSTQAKDNAIYSTVNAPKEAMGYREMPPLPKNIKMLYLSLKPNGKMTGLIPNTNLWLEYKANGKGFSGFMLDWQMTDKEWGWASTSRPNIPVHLPNGQIIYPDGQ